MPGMLSCGETGDKKEILLYKTLFDKTKTHPGRLNEYVLAARMREVGTLFVVPRIFLAPMKHQLQFFTRWLLSCSVGSLDALETNAEKSNQI
jgi:hypothetical protein